MRSELKDPKELVADERLCKSTAELDKAKAVDAQLKAMISSHPGLKDSLQPVIDDNAKTIADLTKKAAGGAATIEAMKAKKQNAIKEHSEREERFDKNRKAAIERDLAVREQFLAQQKELQRRLALFDQNTADSMKAFDGDRKRLHDHHASVVAAWDESIQSLESKAGVEDSSDADPAMKQAVLDFDLFVPWSIEDLPEVIVPNKEEALYWLTLADHVCQWSTQYGFRIACSYSQLMGAPPNPSEAMSSLVRIIGQPYWEKLYSDRTVRDCEVVPRQLGHVLHQAFSAKLYEVAEKAAGDGEAKKSKDVAARGMKGVRCSISKGTLKSR